MIAGPWVSALLSELGANVIKVESLALMDSARGLGDAPMRGMAGMFVGTSPGKKSIVLDLKKVFPRFLLKVRIGQQTW